MDVARGHRDGTPHPALHSAVMTAYNDIVYAVAAELSPQGIRVNLDCAGVMARDTGRFTTDDPPLGVTPRHVARSGKARPMTIIGALATHGAVPSAPRNERHRGIDSPKSGRPLRGNRSALSPQEVQ